MKKKPIYILYTGGGSGGHTAPILAVHNNLKKAFPESIYFWVGSARFEKDAAELLRVPFHEIRSGKLRRYVSFKNITDIVKIKIGILQSLVFLLKKRPTLVFATGGYVSVPVVFSAFLLGVPVVIHEQTISLGLANKINSFFARTILLAFPDSKKLLPSTRKSIAVVTENPVRESLLGGTKDGLEKLLGKQISTNEKILYVTGGSQGSSAVNASIFSVIESLSGWTVIHQCGRSGIHKATSLQNEKNLSNYFPFEFIGKELKDIYAVSSLVVARSGAGTVSELSYFGIPSIFIPLRPCRGDEQTKNAIWFLEKNPGIIIHENNLTKKSLLAEVRRLEKIGCTDEALKKPSNKTAEEIVSLIKNL